MRYLGIFLLSVTILVAIVVGTVAPGVFGSLLWQAGSALQRVAQPYAPPGYSGPDRAQRPQPYQPVQQGQAGESYPREQQSKPAAPSKEEIRFVLAHTFLFPSWQGGTPESFGPSSQPVTVPDGKGGFLTAVVGTWKGSADGGGQLVFFWHNDRFLGIDSDYLSLFPRLTPAGTRIAVTYPHWPEHMSFVDFSNKANELPGPTVYFWWNGTRLEHTPWPEGFFSGPPSTIRYLPNAESQVGPVHNQQEQGQPVQQSDVQAMGGPMGPFRAIVTGKVKRYGNAYRIPVVVGVEKVVNRSSSNDISDLITVDGIIDSGASITSFPLRVLRDAGYAPVSGAFPVTGVGKGPLTAYYYDITYPYIYTGRYKVIGMKFVQLGRGILRVMGIDGFNEALIGADILSQNSFSVTGDTWVLGLK